MSREDAISTVMHMISPISPFHQHFISQHCKRTNQHVSSVTALKTNTTNRHIDFHYTKPKSLLLVAKTPPCCPITTINIILGISYCWYQLTQNMYTCINPPLATSCMFLNSVFYCINLNTNIIRYQQTKVKAKDQRATLDITYPFFCPIIHESATWFRPWSMNHKWTINTAPVTSLFDGVNTLQAQHQNA